MRPTAKKAAGFCEDGGVLGAFPGEVVGGGAGGEGVEQSPG